MPADLSATFVLETTFEVVEKLSTPHKTNTKTIYSQATLIETMGKKYLLFPGHMLAQAQVWLIKEDNFRICLNREHIVFSRVLNLAYLATEHLPGDILESSKAIQLADNLLESGDNVRILDFQLSDNKGNALSIKGDFNSWYFSWHNPKFPLNRLIHSEIYLHPRATLVLPSGNIAPLTGKITSYKLGLVGAPVVNSKNELIGITGVGNRRSCRGYSLIMPSSIIELWIQRQISHPGQIVEFTELPLDVKYYSEYTDVGGHFGAAGLFVNKSGCEAIKPNQYVTHIDGYPFNNLRELKIAPDQPSQELKYFFFQKELRGEETSCQLTVLNEEKPVRVELLRDPERYPIVLPPLPVGKLPYLIIGPFLLSIIYHNLYAQPPVLADDFGKKKELVHIVNVAQGRPHYQRYQGFVVDTINGEPVTSLCDLARRFDEIAPGSVITLTCYVNLRAIFDGNVLTNFIPNLEREHPEFTHPDKILYSLCCKKEAPGIFSEFKEQGFESDRSSCLPTPKPLVTEFKLEDMSGLSTPQVLASSSGQQAYIEEDSSTDEITNKLLERATVEIEASRELSSPVGGDPLHRISFVCKIPGTVIKFEAQYFIVTALRGLTVGFYSAQIGIEIGGQKETLFFDRRNAIFDPSCNLAFLHIPQEVIQQYGSENISAVDLSSESFDFARRDFFYQARISTFQVGNQKRSDSPNKKIKGAFTEYSLHDNSQGSQIFCIEAAVSFTKQHELRGGLIHDRIGQMVGVVVAANYEKGILQLIPHEIIRRSLQKQSISDGNAPMIVRAVILPPPIRTQALPDSDQQAHFTRGSTSISGALIVHAEFFQSADDPVLTGGFKLPSRLRGCLLTAVKIVDERDELHEYNIFFDGRTDHSVYGKVDWRSIFSLHVITSITVSIYNPVTQRNFDEKFPIKEVGILTCLGANPEYTELADYQILTSRVNPFVSSFWYPYSQINLLVMRDHYPNGSRIENKILPGATILGYRVVRCMIDRGHEGLEGVKVRRYVFSDDRKVLRLERVEGDVPIFMFPRSLFPVGTVEYKQEGNLERYSIVQLIVVNSINSKYSGRMNSEVFLPYTKDNLYASKATGFVIRWQNKLYIVTNAHVVAGAKKAIAVNLPIHVHRMMPEAIKNVTICRAWDLALIPIPESSPLNKVLVPLPLAKTSDNLKELVAKGYPAGDGAQVMTLPVTQVKKIFEPSVVDKLVPGEMIHYTGRLEPGSSGSPLIDCEGEVVGVHSEGYSGQEYKQGIPVESLIKLLFCISRGNLCGDVFPGQFLFQLPLVLPSQQLDQPLPLSLTEDVKSHNLKRGDVILTIDGLPVRNGKVSSSGSTMFFHEYSHTQLSGHEFPITVSRDGQVHEEIIISLPFHGGANHSRYYSDSLSAPCLTVILSGCLLTEHYVSSYSISDSKEPGFVSELEDQRLIQLSWCCNLQGAEGETARQRTLSIDLLERVDWFVYSVNGVLISTFADVFSAVNQSNDETIDLILQKSQLRSQEKISIKLPRLTDQQLHHLIEHHKLKSMHVYPGSGLIVSEDIMMNNSDLRPC